MVKLASRVVAAAESATIAVARRAAQLTREGRDLVDLGAGEPCFASPVGAVEAAREALAAGFTRYTTVDGTPDLRAALVRHYRGHGAPWTGDGDVLVTVGAKSALLGSMMALLDPGDEVVLPTPCWGSLPAQIALVGGRTVAVERSSQGGFAFDADALVAAIGDRTRVVLINSPCNPTGAVIGHDALRRLAEVAARRDVVLLVDATYEAFDYRDVPPRQSALGGVRVAAEFPDHVVWISSFSKAFAMTGWRVGYALGPRHVIAGLRSVQSHATTHPTSFAMVGARAALERGGASSAEQVARCRGNRDLLVSALEAMPGVRCAAPDGAFYALPDVSELLDVGGVDGSVALAELLLDRVGVVTVPGAAFGAERHLRLSFAAPRERIEVGVERLREAFGAVWEGAARERPAAALEMP